MRKHNYIVGFKGEKQCVYGKDVFDEQYGRDVASFTKPMTIYQAIRQLAILPGKKKAVYKLVEVRPEKEKLKQKSQMMSK